MKLLYLCYNNKGRSPALEAFTRYFLDKWNIDWIYVDSAGVGVESILSLRRKSDEISRVTRNVLSGYGLNLDSKRIKHLGEVHGSWDLVLAADHHTIETVEEQFPEYSKITQLAKEYAGYKGNSMEIRGPYYYQQKIPPDEWTERTGYEIMINEIKNTARRIAKRMAKKRK